MNRPQVRSHFGESNAALHIFVSELGRWKEEDVICRNNRAFVLRIRSDVESFFNIFVAEISKTKDKIYPRHKYFKTCDLFCP
jgi:hypothetical protein